MPAYLESPLDPLWIGRRLAGAGLAYEKHTFLHPRLGGDADDEVFERGPEGWAIGELRHGDRPASKSVVPPTQLRIHLAMVAPSGDRLRDPVADLLAGWPGRIYLAFVEGVVRGSDKAPRRISDLVGDALGAPVGRPVSSQVATMLQLDGDARRRVWEAMAAPGGDRLYLLADPSSDLLAPGTSGLAWLSHPMRFVPYRTFENAVLSAAWLLTSHHHVVGQAPAMFYTAADPRQSLAPLARDGGWTHALDALPAHAAALAAEVSVTAVAPTIELASVDSLDLTDKPVTSLAVLTTAPKLTSLILDRIAALDEDSLARLTSLEHLSLRGLTVRDARRLASLTRLRSLVLECPLAGSAGLATLPGLVELTLVDQAIADCGFVAALPHLRTLRLSATRDAVDFLGPLARSRARLRFLEASGGITDVGPLQVQVELVELVLERSRIRDIAPLAALSGLRTLSLRDTPVVDADALVGLSGLTSVALAGTAITSLEFVRGLRALRGLDVGTTQVSSIEALATCRGLMSVDLPYTEVHDLAPLAGLSFLESVVLRGAPIASVAPLVDLPRLRYVDVTDCPVPASDVARLAARPGVVVKA